MKSFLTLFKSYQAGDRPSASQMNAQAVKLSALDHLKVVPPLGMRRTSTGFELFLVGSKLDSSQKTFLASIRQVLLNNEPWVGAEGEQPPATPNENVRYRLTYLETPTLPGVSLILDGTWTPAYGRPTKQNGVVIWPAKVGDLCLVCVRRTATGSALVQMFVWSEALKTRECPTNPGGEQLEQLRSPDMSEPSFKNSLGFQLDLNVANSFSDWFDVRQFDYAALSGMVLADAASSWGGTVTVQWSPDMRTAKNTSVTMNSDTCEVVDCTQGYGWVRVKVTTQYGVGSRKVEFKWSAKTDRLSRTDESTDPSLGLLPRTAGVSGSAFGGGGGGGSSGGTPSSLPAGGGTSFS